jgi:hypothetical protein
MMYHAVTLLSLDDKQIERKPRRLIGPESNLFSNTGILIQTVTSINDVFWKLVLSSSRGFMKMLHFKLFLKMKNYLPRIILSLNPDPHALFVSLSARFARPIPRVFTLSAVRQHLT